MQTGFRFRCYPDKAQAQTLLRWIGCQRAIYNAKVSEDRYYRTFARKSLQHTGQFAPQDQRYSQFITEQTPWFRELPSVVLRNGAVRWKQAYGRYWKKLAGRPTIQKKTGAQGVWLTSELFRFDQVIDADTGEVGYRLHVGIKKFPIGVIEYKAHRAHAIPAAITLTVESGRWYLSFTNDDGVVLPSAQETADWLAGFGGTELRERAVGLDRGVAIPLMASTGQDFYLSEKQRQRIQKKQAAARRWQRRLSRRVKGSNNRRKAARRIEVLRGYEKEVRRDFAHQASHRIVGDPKALLIVFEALGVQRMTKKPKAKQDEKGRWLRNGARAKAGLSRSILGSAWGKTKEFCVYKAQRAGKLVIDVPAHHSSQECSACGHTHPDNRLSQAEFVCQCCGHIENADSNASKVIRERGVSLILSGEYREKVRKTTMRMAKKQGSTVGVDRSNRDESRKPVETSVRRQAGNGVVLGSQKQEGMAARPAETSATSQRL
jgi:putative transposase